jgi:hypothetical protein
MKTTLIILALSAVCFAGLFSREVKRGMVEGSEDNPFTSIVVIACEDSIVVIEKDLINSAVVKTVYIPRGRLVEKTETTGRLVNVPAKTEIEWNK